MKLRLWRNEMKGIIRYIKGLFRHYDIEHEYWVNTKDIKINLEWRETKVGYTKFKRKNQYYDRTGEFESKIILRRSDMQLVDGYSSFLIAERRGIDKIPVYFVD